jgi:NAD(P) transhydrogenase subunit beta
MENLSTAAYLAAAVLFILSLGGLSNQETARRGNRYGIVGMIIAMIATAGLADIFSWNATAWGLIAGPVVVGSVVGAVLAARVAMTGMPQLVAILHSFVGLAAVLVGLSSFYHPGEELHGGEEIVHLVEIWIGVAIGAITFTGSIVAWAKLRGSLSGRPLLLPGRHALNAIVVALILGSCVPFVLGVTGGSAVGLSPQAYLLAMTVLASLIGIHLVMAIGGADMPVVVSLLNSYSGWAAAAAGFMLDNNLLIVTGALVGSSGAILSYIMCTAMNRSIWNVVFGGFGTAGGAPVKASAAVAGDITEIDIEGAAELAAGAKSVMIVPGYGMAVARAQHVVNDFSKALRKRGVNVRYAIHPVAGRLPGHMNVLLAEAGVPYDIVLEMDEINDDCPETDLVFVIGANDIVNPGAETDESSPIFGMPVIQVWKAKTVIVLKRGMSAGYAGVANPLFFESNTRMLFGDAKESMTALVGTQD